MSLEERIENLTERLIPQPPMMQTIIITRYDGITDPATIRAPNYYLGRYATCCFLGGTEKERRQEVKRLRQNGTYDQLPQDQPAIGTGEPVTDKT